MAIAVNAFPIPQGKRDNQSDWLKNRLFHLDESLAPPIEFLYLHDSVAKDSPSNSFCDFKKIQFSHASWQKISQRN
jgi:hypothetical protein